MFPKSGPPHNIGAIGCAMARPNSHGSLVRSPDDRPAGPDGSRVVGQVALLSLRNMNILVKVSQNILVVNQNLPNFASVGSSFCGKDAVTQLDHLASQRAMRNYFRHWHVIQAIPAVAEKGRKSNGQNFPAGVIPGFELFLDPPVLLKLALLFHGGCKDILCGWNLALDNLF